MKTKRQLLQEVQPPKLRFVWSLKDWRADTIPMTPAQKRELLSQVKTERDPK